MEAFIRNFLLSIVVPAILAGGSYWMLSKQDRIPRAWTALLAGVEASIAVAIGYFLLSGRLPLWPRESIHWLIYVGVFAAVAAGLLAAFEKPSARVAIMVATVTLVTFALVRPLWFSSWKPIQAIWLTGMLLAAGTIIWAMLHLAMEELQRPWVMGAIIAVFACTCVAVAASGSISLAQFGGIFTAVLAPLVAIAWTKPNSAVLGMAIPFSALTLLALLTNAHFYAELGWIAALLIFLSPVVGWTLVRFGPDEGLMARGYMRLILIAVPAASAVVYTILISVRSDY